MRLWRMEKKYCRFLKIPPVESVLRTSRTTPKHQVFQVFRKNLQYIRVNLRGKYTVMVNVVSKQSQVWASRAGWFPCLVGTGFLRMDGIGLDFFFEDWLPWFLFCLVRIMWGFVELECCQWEWDGMGGFCLLVRVGTFDKIFELKPDSFACSGFNLKPTSQIFEICIYSDSSKR